MVKYPVITKYSKKYYKALFENNEAKLFTLKELRLYERISIAYVEWLWSNRKKSIRK
jgi:hypothetical protein